MRWSRLPLLLALVAGCTGGRQPYAADPLLRHRQPLVGAAANVEEAAPAPRGEPVAPPMPDRPTPPDRIARAE